MSCHGALLGGVTLLVFGVFALACGESEQLKAVDELTEGGYLTRVACLDTNGDGLISAGDAQGVADVDGDGVSDETDAGIVSAVEIPLAREPESCGDASPADWLITEPVVADCAAGERPVLLYGVGGGDVDFTDRENAAGVRWMMHEMSKALSEADLPNYSASVAPSLKGMENGNIAAERWSRAVLTQALGAQPCLQVVLIGHSHGAIHVKAVAAELEAAGLGEQVVLTVLIDRSGALYGGTLSTFPSVSPMLIFYQQGAAGSSPLDAPNAENVDAASFLAPEQGEEGGDLVTATHATIDNSPDVLEVVMARVFDRLGLQPPPTTPVE